MKRAFLVIIAALLVCLSYPSTHTVSASSDNSTNIQIISTKGGSGGPMLDGEEGEDEGDADGVAGIKGKAKPGMGGVTSSGTRVVVTVRTWWNLLFWFR